MIDAWDRRVYGKLDAPGTPCPARSPRSCCSVQLEPGRTRRLRVESSGRLGKPVSGWDGWMGLICGDRSDSTEQTEGRGESFGVDFPVPMAGWRGLTRSLRRLHVRRFALTARKRATTRVVAPYVAATPRDRSRVSRTAGLRRDSSAQPAASTALDANPSARLLPRNARRP